MEQGEEGQGFEAVNTESVSRDNEPWRVSNFTSKHSLVSNR